MKKFIKLFLIFTLVFTFTFNYVKAEPDDPESGSEIQPLIASAPVVSVRGNNNTLILSWEAVENATSYVIARSTNAKKGFKNIKTVTTTTFTDTKLKYGTTYYYKVTAKGTSNSKTSGVVHRKVVPNKVTITNLQPYSAQVKVTWGKTNNSGYYVYRSTNGKKWAKVATIKKNSTTSFVDKKLKSNTRYYYQVQAFQKVGKKTLNGAKSAVMNVVTSPAAPKVVVRSEGLNDITLNITKTAGAVKYEVYRAPSKNGKYTYEFSIPSEWFTSNTYKEWWYVDDPYVMQYFKIRACSATSCGSFRAVSGQGALYKNMIESLKGANKTVTLEWTYSWGAEGYEIFRATKKNGKYTKIKTVNKDTFRYVDKSVKSGKTYYYKVRSYMTTSNKKKHYSAFSGVRKVTTGKNAGINSAMEDAKVISREYYPSKTVLIGGLVEYYGYTQNEAKKGVEKAKINFKENALKYAKDVVNWYSAVTEDIIRSELSAVGFTEAEITYALSKIKIDWHTALTRSIQNEMEYGVSKQYLLDYYTNAGFTQEQVLSVIEELNINFNNQAVVAIEDYIDSWGYDAGISSK